MPTLNHDLGYVRESLPILSNYLLSKDIYWSLGASPPVEGPGYPQMTLGGVLLAMTRVHAQEVPPVLLREVQHFGYEIDQIRIKWQVAWENKARREFGARLRLWGNFIDEYRREPDSHHDRYPYEVNRRVMLHLLEKEADDIPAAERELLIGLDGLLQAVFIAGEFIWEREIESGFPRDSYWFLYGRIRG